MRGPLLLIVLLAAGCQWMLPLSAGEGRGASEAGAGERRDGPRAEVVDLGPLCLNGVVDPGEECDGAVPKDKTCEGLGFPPGGTLSCTRCALDTSGCTKLPAKHLTLVYGNSTGLVIRRMELATSSWGPEVKLPLVGAVRWTQNRISPVDLGDEVAAALTETATGLRLYLLHFGAGGWSIDQMIELAIPALDRDKRVFDLAFETVSGAALLVHSDETADPVYRTYQKTSGWSGPTKVFGGAQPGSAPVRYVRLAANPLSNDLALAYADAATSVHAAQRKGGAFGQPITMCEGPTGEAYQSFDVAYTGITGHLLSICGNTCCSCMGYEVDLKDPSAPQVCSAEAWQLIKLVPRAKTDEIAAALDRRMGVIWKGPGKGWSTSGQLNPVTAIPNDQYPWFADVAWIESPTPTALLVYRGWAPYDGSSTGPGTGKILWGTSLVTTWSWTAGKSFAISGLGVVEWPLLKTVDDSHVIAVVADSNRSLWTATFSAGAWGAASSVGSDLAQTVTRAFSMDLR
jgi:hypothetical protein